MGTYSSPHAGKVPFAYVLAKDKTHEIIGLSGEIETFGLYKIAREIVENLGQDNPFTIQHTDFDTRTRICMTSRTSDRRSRS